MHGDKYGRLSCDLNAAVNNPKQVLYNLHFSENDQLALKSPNGYKSEDGYLTFIPTPRLMTHRNTSPPEAISASTEVGKFTPKLSLHAIFSSTFIQRRQTSTLLEARTKRPSTLGTTPGCLNQAVNMISLQSLRHANLCRRNRPPEEPANRGSRPGWMERADQVSGTYRSTRHPSVLKSIYVHG